MLDTQGFIAETNATHVFLVEAGGIATAHTRACPEGITRATVLALCERNGIPCEVRDLTTTDAFGADEMFCTGTMGELAPVIEVDGRTIGSGRVGPVTRRLSELYACETATVGYPILEN